MEQIVLSLTT